MALVAQLSECTKNHQTVHFKRLRFMKYEFYFNKAAILKKKNN